MYDKNDELVLKAVAESIFESYKKKDLALTEVIELVKQHNWVLKSTSLSTAQKIIFKLVMEMIKDELTGKERNSNKTRRQKVRGFQKNNPKS